MGHIIFMIFIVVSSVFNAFAYTGGPWPLGYLGLPSTFSIGYVGLGDLFVFLYFGLVATLIPPFLFVTMTTTTTTMISSSDPQHHIGTSLLSSLLLTDLLPRAIQVAALATNIIVVNNLRDRHTDVLAGKKTLAVRFGGTFCRIEYGIMLLVTYGLVIVDCLYYVAAVSASSSSATTTTAQWLLLLMLRGLPFLSLPMAWTEWTALYTKDGSALNQHVGGAARVQLLFCILLALSVRLTANVNR